MTSRVEQHPERRPRLELVPVAPSAMSSDLRGVEVVDDHVEVHLLGHLLARPLGAL